MRPIFIFLGRSVLLFLITFSILSRAESPQCGTATLSESRPIFAQTIHGPLTFQQVELISRNHNIGLYRGGKIRLEPWIEVSPKAFIGIDSKGRVLNVIELEDRTIAFLLSGERKIKDIFLKPPGDLMAIDADGEVLKFGREGWDKSILPELLRKAARHYLGAMCTVSAGLLLYSWLGEIPILAPEIISSLGISSSAALMIQGFRTAAHYEQQNENTDGFKPIGFQVPNLRRSEFVRDNSGLISDYKLKGSGVETSLLSMIKSALSKSNLSEFDLKCEYALLARGIPPEAYEPKF